jgi:pyridoxamine 5'-phosphate oxidase
MTEDHRHIRREYTSQALHKSQLSADPVAQFTSWLESALSDELTDATAMSLATANQRGVPSVRVVLLKAHDADGFVFYTDYGSQKGREAAANPMAELLFHWREHNRQVRISGAIEKTSRRDAEDYFASRPLASQLSAAASMQSSVIANRQALEDKVTAIEGGDLDCPANWGGYRLQPDRFEFWQGRENRLHDRFVYARSGPNWQIERLQP